MSSTSGIGFTAGGIDVSSIVSGLMDVERQPLRALQTRQATAKSQATAIDGLRSDLDLLRTQSLALNGAGLTKLSTSYSASGIVAASQGAGATPGSLTFTVDRLASAHGMRTAVAAASADDAITTAGRLAISNTAAGLGIGGIRADSATSAGTTTLSITQSSAAAMKTGTAVSVPAVVDATNDTLTFVVDGVARTVSLAHGTYTSAGLAVAVQAALDAAGGGARVALQTNGALRIATTREGSAASLQVTGGTGLAVTGLSVDATAARGTDAVVSVNGTTTTVTDVTAGGTADVSNGSGTFTLTFNGGLRTGSARVATVDTGTRSLSAVASAINAAGLNVSASVTQAASGSFYLQINSGATGAAGALVTDTASILGGVVQNSAAQDASITVGSGPGAFTVTAAGNEFRNVMNGTTITALQASTTPVTVTVKRDDAATADAVGRLVDQINAVLKKVGDLTKFDTVTKASGPLSGNAAVRGAAAKIRAAVTGIIDTTALPANIGITARRNGTIAFDRSQFLNALANDPATVSTIFSRTGTTSGGVSFVDAGDTTAPGSHTVNVLSVATQATATGPALTSVVTGQQLALRRGSQTAIYTVPAGASTADIVTGLQAAADAARIDVTVSDNAGSLGVQARVYGSAGSFDLNTDLGNAGPWTTTTGADVTGTVDGITASGIGTRLTVPQTAAADSRGLAVDVAAGAAVGTVTIDYKPGVAARLGQLLGSLTDAAGSLSSGTYNDRVNSLQTQMDRFQSRLADKEVALRRQWSVIQTSLQSLQAQGTWLANQVGSSK